MISRTRQIYNIDPETVTHGLYELVNTEDMPSFTYTDFWKQVLDGTLPAIGI